MCTCCPQREARKSGCDWENQKELVKVTNVKGDGRYLVLYSGTLGGLPAWIMVHCFLLARRGISHIDIEQKWKFSWRPDSNFEAPNQKLESKEIIGGSQVFRWEYDWSSIAGEMAATKCHVLILFWWTSWTRNTSSIPLEVTRNYLFCQGRLNPQHGALARMERGCQSTLHPSHQLRIFNQSGSFVK